jgi:hypothetical protein
MHAAPLERGRRNPRKGYGRLPRARTGQCRDVGLVERVSSANSGPVRPSPPLCSHIGHCSAIPGAVGARDDKTSPSPPLCILRPSVSYTLEPEYGRRTKREVAHTATLEAAPGQAEDSIRRPLGARFVMTTINSTVLYTIPPYVALELYDTIVNCLPLAYKRRGQSPGRGGRRIVAHLHVFRLHHDIGTSPQSIVRDLETPLLPPRL